MGRNATVLSQLRAVGLYPAFDAPEYRESTVFGTVLGSRSVPPGYSVAITASAGTMYYTTNGADPRVAYSGAVSPDAILYTSPLVLGHSVTLKCRALNGATWTALNEATFSVAELGVPLRFLRSCITRLAGTPTSLSRCRMSERYRWTLVDSVSRAWTSSSAGVHSPAGRGLRCGLLGEPRRLCRALSPSGLAGYFEGSLLNAGERLAMVDRNDNTVIAVFFDDEAGWPAGADGSGYSLESMNPRGDLQAPANWRTSGTINGTPGFPPSGDSTVSPVLLNELMAFNLSAVPNGSTFPDWIELRNTAPTNVNLANWSLSDDSDPRKYVFPAGTVITMAGTSSFGVIRQRVLPVCTPASASITMARRFHSLTHRRTAWTL